MPIAQPDVGDPELRFLFSKDSRLFKLAAFHFGPMLVLYIIVDGVRWSSYDVMEAKRNPEKTWSEGLTSFYQVPFLKVPLFLISKSGWQIGPYYVDCWEVFGSKW